MGLTSFARYQSRDHGVFIEKRIGAAVEAAIQVWANDVLDVAKSIVAVDTGELRDSGHTVVTNSGKSAAAAVVFDSPHAVFVEFGTGIRGAASPGAGPYPYSPTWPGMPAQPYLRPAFESLRTQAEGVTKAWVGASL